MANKLAEALALLGEKLKAYAGTSVTYTRGAHSVTLTATVGRMLLKTTDRSGNTKTELTHRDFTFLAADLILNGSQVEPAEGDLITVVMAGDTRRFTVMPVGNEPAWRYADEQQETTIRVHAKHTSNP